jgi:hypothetical protein
MLDFGGLLSVLLFGVWVYAIIDALVTDKASVRNLPKWGWLAVIILLFVLGAALWFVLGRPTRPFSGARAESGRTGSSLPTRPTPPRRVRPPSRAERAEEEADIRARIAERDRLLAQWAEEDQRKSPPDAPGSETR